LFDFLNIVVVFIIPVFKKKKKKKIQGDPLFHPQTLDFKPKDYFAVETQMLNFFQSLQQHFNLNN